MTQWVTKSTSHTWFKGCSGKMGLDAQGRIMRAVTSVAQGLFRVSIVKVALEEGLQFLQAYGHGDPDETDDQELLQEDDLDHVQHFGFRSSPPADTEAIVAEVDGGMASIAERDSVEDLTSHGTADQMPTLATGDTCLYSQDGTYIYLDADGKLTIKSLSGNIEVITEAGDIIKLGQDGADYYPCAYSDTTEITASQVSVATGLKTYMDKIDVDLAAIKTDMTNIDALLGALGTLTANIVLINAWIVTHTTAATPLIAHPVIVATITLGPPGAKAATTLVPTTAALAIDTKHSYVSTGSAKVYVEP